jgi:hypothetical protein
VLEGRKLVVDSEGKSAAGTVIKEFEGTGLDTTVVKMDHAGLGIQRVIT